MVVKVLGGGCRVDVVGAVIDIVVVGGRGGCWC